MAISGAAFFKVSRVILVPLIERVVFGVLMADSSFKIIYSCYFF
jgi:hypothetical protein